MIRESDMGHRSRRERSEPDVALRVAASVSVARAVSAATFISAPAHLRYLESFLERRPMSPLFPLSVTVGRTSGPDPKRPLPATRTTFAEIVAHRTPPRWLRRAES